MWPIVVLIAFLLNEANGQTSTPASAAGSGSNQPAGANSGCADFHENCCNWAKRGECDLNPFYMKTSCAKSCGTCGVTVANAISIPSKPDLTCTRSVVGNPNAATPAPVKSAPTATGGRPGCTDNQPLCEFWAFQGHCLSNPLYMNVNCRMACRIC